MNPSMTAGWTPQSGKRPVSLLLALAIVPFLVGQAQAGGSTRPEPSADIAQQHAAAASLTPRSATASPKEASVSVRQGRLTLHVKNQSLEIVLKEIADKTGIVIANPEITRSTRITTDLKDLPIATALAHLLYQYDVFAAYEGTAQPPASLKRVWLVPQSEGQGMVPVQGVSDPELDDPARAAELAMDRAGAPAEDLVLRAITDGDEGVRYRALSKALASNIDLSPEVLKELIQSDPSEDVRLAALTALALNQSVSKATVEVVAQDALHDSSPAIQSKAAEILSQFETLEQTEESQGGLQVEPDPDVSSDLDGGSNTPRER